MAVPYKWPHAARTAVALTLDNMGEAADLDCGLWPDHKSVGSHYSVTEALPNILALLKKYDIYATYFIESWNFAHYPTVIANQIAAAGHEVAWHGYRHEKWSNLTDEKAERENFERSFGMQGLEGFITGSGKGRGKMLPYYGFRPPGGVIQGNRTLALCKEYGLGYISPAAENAAVVSISGTGRRRDSIVVLPFRWQCVDSYYYMDSFSELRRSKGEQAAPRDEEVLVRRYIVEINQAIENGTFLALTFHPFLNHTTKRLQAMETVIRYLASKREAGQIWLARCRDIEHHVRKYPRSVAENPNWETSSWA